MTFSRTGITQGVLRKLNQTSDSLMKVQERLSSGFRINRASDDAAGLSVSSILNAKSRIEAQGIRNLSDGISLFSIADQAVGSLKNILGRQIELAEQSANGVVSASQRGALHEEAQALRSEYNRILETTKFNGINLLSGDLGTFIFQAGIGEGASLALELRKEMEQIVSVEQNLELGGGSSSANFATQTRFLVLRGDDDDNDVLIGFSYDTAGGRLMLRIETFIDNGDGELGLVSSTFINTNLNDPGATPHITDAATFSAALSGGSINLRMDASILGSGTYIAEHNISISSSGVLGGVSAGFTNPVDQTNGSVYGNFTGLSDNETVTALKLSLSFTANLSKIEAGLADLSQNAFSLIEQNTALAALDELKSQLSFLSDIQSQIGAGQSRIAVAVNVLSVSREQNIAASSRITDADVGKETSELIRLSILQDAGAAVLAQVNASGEIALLLLGNN